MITIAQLKTLNKPESIAITEHAKIGSSNEILVLMILLTV